MYRFCKRLFDIVCATLGIIGTSPIWIISIILTELSDPGPLFYFANRVGKDNKKFKMWKFRSMCKDADKMKDALLAENEVEGPMFKMRDDPRVTRIGRFIRRHSIDEFPQFLNVLLGDMSVVGPRPPLPREVAQYDELAMQRLAVKPGLTGP